MRGVGARQEEEIVLQTNFAFSLQYFCHSKVSQMQGFWQFVWIYFYKRFSMKIHQKILNHILILYFACNFRFFFCFVFCEKPRNQQNRKISFTRKNCDVRKRGQNKQSLKFWSPTQNLPITMTYCIVLYSLYLSSIYNSSNIY